MEAYQLMSSAYRRALRMVTGYPCAPPSSGRNKYDSRCDREFGHVGLLCPPGSRHSAGSGIRSGRLIGSVGDDGDCLSKRSSRGNPKPLTRPKIAGITISVSSVEE